MSQKPNFVLRQTGSLRSGWDLSCFLVQTPHFTKKEAGSREDAHSWMPNKGVLNALKINS